MIVRNKLSYRLVAHCQLACKGCATQSEHATPSFNDINQFKKDINTLSKFMRFNSIQLSGGEPLLHKKIIDFLKIIKTANMCDDIRVTTNGELLYRQPDEFWELIDSIELSLYPTSGIDNDEVLKDTLNKCEEFGVTLIQHHKNHFREIYYYGEARDNKIVQQIYDSCELKETENCDIIDNGRYLKCVGPLILNKTQIDGADLNETDIINYLKSNKPLESCKNCLALTGEEFPHEQVKKAIPIKILDKAS